MRVEDDLAAAFGGPDAIVNGGFSSSQEFRKRSFSPPGPLAVKELDVARGALPNRRYS